MAFDFAPFSTVTVENGAKSNVILTYNIPLNESIIPATTDFALAGKTINSVSISGAVVTIAVSVAYAFGDSISLNYTQGTNKLQSTLGGLAASFNGQSVTNNILAAASVVSTTAVSAILQTTATLAYFIGKVLHHSKSLKAAVRSSAAGKKTG